MVNGRGSPVPAATTVPRSVTDVAAGACAAAPSAASRAARARQVLLPSTPWRRSQPGIGSPVNVQYAASTLLGPRTGPNKRPVAPGCLVPGRPARWPRRGPRGQSPIRQGLPLDAAGLADPPADVVRGA